MLVTESGMVIEVRDPHPSNASFPRLVTELGMVTEVRDPHCWNAESPMLVTELGMVTEVRLEQRRNASFGMVAPPDQVRWPVLSTSLQDVPP